HRVSAGEAPGGIVYHSGGVARSRTMDCQLEPVIDESGAAKGRDPSAEHDPFAAPGESDQTCERNHGHDEGRAESADDGEDRHAGWRGVLVQRLEYSVIEARQRFAINDVLGNRAEQGGGEDENGDAEGDPANGGASQIVSPR